MTKRLRVWCGLCNLIWNICEQEESADHKNIKSLNG